ncbi:hypothetical protein OYT88_11945 [Sporolactobacillus sp. CQH2019]|uniref:hypothetical protein n=1 Tax=Sporolactobacillus sp. CQH2019 TaxID=3023512 RepID=UPI0023682102|nr:hypothetical protein [Sporolactobacillus sp. CQH2019]MDD9149266.1 hypothetical protein [Sporolactobacillus sp. CQH2019]
MSLTSTQQTTVTGTSSVASKPVASMTASITTSGVLAYLNVNINDAATYADNKAAVRADIQAFLTDLFNKEDGTDTTTSTTQAG